MVNHPLNSVLNKIKELERIISIFDNREDSFTSIDRDLVLEKIRGLYNEILSIDVSVSKPNELSVSLPEKENNIGPTFRKIENNSVFEIENQSRIDVAINNSEIKKLEKSKPSDLFGSTVKNRKNENPDINEKLSRKMTKRTLVDNHKMAPIKDLNEAIEINKKFSFLNELFKGNIQEYSQAINHLNNCENLSDAENFLQNNLGEKYDWKKDEKKELVNDLLEFLQRRYPSNIAS